MVPYFLGECKKFSRMWGVVTYQKIRRARNKHEYVLIELLLYPFPQISALIWNPSLKKLILRYTYRVCHSMRCENGFRGEIFPLHGEIGFSSHENSEQGRRLSYEYSSSHWYEEWSEVPPIRITTDTPSQKKVDIPSRMSRARVPIGCTILTSTV